MSFDIGGGFNQLADAVYRMPIIGSAIASPFWAALLLTAVAAVIVLAVYHSSVRDVLRSQRGVRAFLYVFGAVLLITSLHYYATRATIGVGATRAGYRDVVDATESARATGGGFPVDANGSPLQQNQWANESIENLAAASPSGFHMPGMPHLPTMPHLPINLGMPHPPTMPNMPGMPGMQIPMAGMPGMLGMPGMAGMQMPGMAGMAGMPGMPIKGGAVDGPGVPQTIFTRVPPAYKF